MKKNIILMAGKHFSKIPMFSIFLIALFTQCEIQEDFDYKTSNPGGKFNITAWEFIQQTDSLSLMEEAISVAGLQDMFMDSSERTFFIPRNEAFREFLKANGYNNFSEIPVPILKHILLYHIIEGKVLFSDPAFYTSNAPVAYETENGQQIYLSRNTNYQGIINQGTNKSWTIITSNIEPANGAIHISPSVLYFSAITGNTTVPDPTVVSDTIYAIQDTYINGGNQKDVNFGSNILIKVKDVDGMGDYDRKTFLMFNLKDIKKEGKLRDARVEVGVNFTHAKGLRLSIFEVPDTTWSEMSMTWNNAPAASDEISHIITTKVSVFKWDCTSHIAAHIKIPGKISVMIDGEPGGNETNDLISKENTKLPHPMLITTFSSGNSNLAMGINTGLTVSNGGITVLTGSMLEMSGAEHADIIYRVENSPAEGWLVMGTTILTDGCKFTQLDIDMGNVVYVHSGNGSSDDVFSLSVSDRDGGSIDPFNVEVTVL